MSGVLDNARYITFNGTSNTYYGLVMSGNTPLLVPKPKQTSITVPYSHGTIDTSELDNQLYWNDLSISYSFVVTIPVLYSGTYRTTDQMNALCTDKIDEVDAWLYSGPATLADTGWTFSLSDAECTSINAQKVIKESLWAIRFDVAFKAPFTLTMSRPTTVSSSRIGRFILYNGGASYEYGLVMSGSTPLSAETPKITSMDWPHKNGSLNLSHCRQGNTSGKDSLFFNDRQITYNFFKSFSKYDNQGHEIPAYLMNQELQDFVLDICCWLYKHTGNSFVTIDGNVTYGGTSIMLADSAWISGTTIPVGGSVSCDILPSARVSNLNVNKSIANDLWALAFEVTFTTYPIFSSGSIYFPSPQDPSPTPSIVIQPWKHYADFNSFDGEETRILWFLKDHTLEYQAMSLNIMDGIYMGCNEVIQTYHGVGYRDDDGLYEYVGYFKSSSNIQFYNRSELPTYGVYIPIAVDEYVHPSMEDYDSENYLFPTLILWVPPVKEITIDGNERLFIPNIYFGSSLTNYATLMAKYVIRKMSNGSVVENTSYQNVGAVIAGVYDFTALVVNYYHINENGFGQTIPETDDKFVGLDIDVPIHLQYLQRISGNNVVDAYGLYAKDADNAPENFKVLPYEIVFDYTGEELEIYYRNGVTCPLVNTDPGHTVHGPEYYREFIASPSSPDSFPGAVAITIPIVNGEANQYILCDGTTPPKGGDIQWLP